MAQLADEDKVRYLGLSGAAPDTMGRAQRAHAVAALQRVYRFGAATRKVSYSIRCARDRIRAYSPFDLSVAGCVTVFVEANGPSDSLCRTPAPELGLPLPEAVFARINSERRLQAPGFRQLLPCGRQGPSRSTRLPHRHSEKLDVHFGLLRGALFGDMETVNGYIRGRKQ
jgi:hypothetical protein